MSLDGLREIFTSFGDTVRTFFKDWPYKTQENIGTDPLNNNKRYTLSQLKTIWEKFRDYGHNLNFLLGYTDTNKKYNNEEDLYTLELPELVGSLYNFTLAHQQNSDIKKLRGNLIEIMPYFCNQNYDIEEIDFPEAACVKQGAFEGAINLKKAFLPKLTTVGPEAFFNAQGLKEIDLTNVTSIDNQAFSNTALEEVNISNWSYKNGLPNGGSGQFSNNKYLTTVNWGESKSDIPNSCFYNCTKLKNFNKSGQTQYVENSAFANCSSLEKISLYFCQRIYAKTFLNCSSLTTLQLAQNMVIPLENSNALQGTPIADGTGYIYVPSNLIDEYKTAANWSLYANQFKTIQELPQT